MPRNSILFILVLSLFFIFSSHHAAAQGCEAEASKPACKLLEKMKKKYSALKTLSAEFDQTVRVKSLDQKKESQGSLMVKKPSFIRWEVKDPADSRSLFVFLPGEAWFYTPPFFEGDTGQAIHKKGSALEQNPAIQLLSGDFSFVENFTLSVLPQDPRALKLTSSKGDKSDIETIVLKLNNKDLIEEIDIVHEGGNETVVNLKNFKVNPQLSHNLFRFSPPAGTTVIDQ